MSGFSMRRPELHPKLSLLFMILMALSLPPDSSAEPMLVFRSEEIPPQKTRGQNDLTTLGINEQGDLCLRKGDMTVIMAYNSTYDRSIQGDSNPARTGIGRTIQPVSAVSVRLGFVF